MGQKNKYWIAIFLLIIGFYLFTRINRLAELPIFTDEALYLRWTQEIKNNSSMWLLPLIEDGQPPLFIWLNVLLNLFISDSLISIRLLAVGFGLINLIFTILIVRHISHSPWSDLVAGLLYVITPFIWWYDRLGMRESAMITVFLLTFFAVYQRVVNKSSRYWWLLSLALLVGILIKSLAWYLVPIILISYLIFKIKVNTIDYLGLALGIGLPVLISSQNHLANNVLIKNQIFISSYAEVLDNIRPNAIQTVQWLYQLLTPWLLITALVCIVSLYIYQRSLFKLIMIFSLPIFINIFIAKIYFPRYFLFVIPIILIGISATIDRYLKKVNHYLLITFTPILILFIVFINSWLLADYTVIPLPEIERWQYISGWPAGFGIRSMADHLITLNPNLIITETTDVSRTGLGYYQPSLNDRVESLSSTDQLSEQLKIQISSNLIQEEPVYLLLNRLDTLPVEIDGNLIKQTFKPNDKTSLRLYEVISVN